MWNFKPSHCNSYDIVEYIDILRINLVERRRQFPSYQTAGQDADRLLGYQPPSLTSKWEPYNKDHLVATRRSRFARQWSSWLGIPKASVLLRGKDTADFGNNTGWENFAVSSSQAMPDPEDKAPVGNVSINPERDSCYWIIHHILILLAFCYW